ncbi:MAG: beta-ketoacyl synthase [Candidatus Omnitrophota bacterium]
MVEILSKESPSQNGRRVVVTGLGVVSSIGIGWQEFWKNLIAGKSGISRITSFDVSMYERKYAGEIKNFDANLYINRKKIKFLGRSSQFAITAAKLALEDSNFEVNSTNSKNIIASIGMTMAEMTELEKYNDSIYTQNCTINGNDVALKFPAFSISSNVARELGLNGKNIVFSSACAAGNYSICYAYDQIKNSTADYALAGGSDSFSRVVFTGFSRLFAIADKFCQPFDKNRSGMIPGEGSAILFLESYESAVKRNAKIYAEILGFGMSCDAFHMTIPSVESVSKAIMKCLMNSELSIEQINYICAHGTGTKENDETEVAAVIKVFKNRSRYIPMSSIKSMLGHTMGAASALEAVSCCLSLDCQVVPPTINFTEKDPLCDIDCVPNKAREATLEIILNNSQAFGGNNACVALKTLKQNTI